jgi:hypothetical protein
MKRFDKKGAIIIPNSQRDTGKEPEKFIVFTELFCPEGHSLISPRVKFNGYCGILLAASQDGRKGFIGLSPVYGEKVRVTMDFDISEGERMSLSCPVCSVKLPVYSPCICGGHMIALFRTPRIDFAECVAVCDKAGCNESGIIYGGELITESMLEIL